MLNHDFVIRCVMVQFLYNHKVKMTKYLHLPTNFTLNIITFTDHVKAQKLIFKSIVYIEFSQLEARILADISKSELIDDIYCKQPGR